MYGLGNTKKASELGNTRRGDGFLYRGGGLMQTTGRANFRRMGEKSGVAFEDQPDLIVSAEHALKPALIEWSEQKLNGFADEDEVLAISRAINIGNPRSTRTPNGLTDRREWLRKARSEIGESVTFLAADGAPAAALTPPASEGAAIELREIQRRLRAMKLYADEIDNDFGPNTRTAILALFMNQGVKGTSNWTELRLIIGAGQLLCRMEGIEVGPTDGFLGPQTQQAFENYNARLHNGGAVTSVVAWRDQDAEIDDEEADTAGEAVAKAPAAAGAPPVWPRESGVPAFFGTPGSNQVKLILPFKMRLAWDTDTVVAKTSCHAKVRDNLERIWSRTLDHYGLEEVQRLRLDLFGGCLNVRKKRGGSSWSMHAFGIAWDVDPAHNQLKMGRDDATLDGSEYDAFWRFVADEGAISLGRERNFDWMHLQFARL